MLTFEVYFSGLWKKSWKWRAVAPNGRIMASGRGFNSKESCIESIEQIMWYVNHNSTEIKFV